MGLIRNALEQGRQAVEAIHARRPRGGNRFDLLIVGAGPAGFAASLTALSTRSVVSLQAAGASPSRADARGDTALLLAIRTGRADVLNELLNHGVSLDEHTVTSEPTVVAAAKSDQPAIVRALIQAGGRTSTPRMREDSTASCS